MWPREVAQEGERSSVAADPCCVFGRGCESLAMLACSPEVSGRVGGAGMEAALSSVHDEWRDEAREEPAAVPVVWRRLNVSGLECTRVRSDEPGAGAPAERLAALNAITPAPSMGMAMLNSVHLC